jgi:hypothetical protein
MNVDLNGTPMYDSHNLTGRARNPMGDRFGRLHEVGEGFVIAGPLDPLDGKRLYWSNVYGWVDRATATVFDDPTVNDPIESTGREAY